MNTQRLQIWIMLMVLLFTHQAFSAGTETGEWTLLGSGAGANIASGADNNTLIGFNAGNALTDSDNNTFVGDVAGKANTSGERNTFVGQEAGASNTTGSNNTFIGENAGIMNSTAEFGVFIGQGAGFSNTSGNKNTFIGKGAGVNNTTAHDNTFLGHEAGQSNTTGPFNTFLGESAGRSNTTSGNNTYVGEQAGTNTTGDDNTLIGTAAGGLSLTTGRQNTMLGVLAGYESNGDGNVLIGYYAGRNASGSNKLYIENSSSSSPLIYGEFDNDIVGINGTLGVGTQLPSSTLHVLRADGSAQVLVQETNATTLPRTLMNLQNNGRPEIVMGNTGTNGEWSFGAGTNFILKQGAVGTTSAAKTKLLTLFAGSGNLEITGSIITGGPTCAAGCDAVFSDDYDLPSIEEHANQMYALGHLPNVGPTVPGMPVNLTDKMGDLLNELEHAHIYIAQLEQKTSQKQAELYATVAQQQDELTDYKSVIAALTGRLERLERLSFNSSQYSVSHLIQGAWQ